MGVESELKTASVLDTSEKRDKFSKRKRKRGEKVILKRREDIKTLVSFF